MQNNPQQAPQNNKWKDILQTIWRVAKNNWPFKLLALLISIALWSGLITQDPNLTRERVFDDVKITISGADAMKRNGLIVTSDLEEVLGTARLEVDVPQMRYDSAAAGFFNVRVDLSRISETGPQELKILTTNSATYGNVSSVSPESVQIEVEEYITRSRIPVNVNAGGNMPEGYYAGTAQADPPLVAVSGPKSLVDKIVQAEAVLNMANLPQREGTVRTAVPFYLLDEEGNRVESPLLSVTSESVLLDSVVVEQYVYSAKSMKISDLGLVTGKPADGYEIKSVSFSPDVVKAAGRATNLDLLDTLYATSAVDVSGKKESFQQQLKVRRPTELIYLSADTITVEVEIGPVIQKKEVEDQRVKVIHLDDTLRAYLHVNTVDVAITGPKLWVQGLRNYHLELSCDVAGLAPGEYELPVACTIQNDEGQTYTVDIMPATVKVTIEEW